MKAMHAFTDCCRNSGVPLKAAYPYPAISNPE